MKQLDAIWLLLCGVGRGAPFWGGHVKAGQARGMIMKLEDGLLEQASKNKQKQAQANKSKQTQPYEALRNFVRNLTKLYAIFYKPIILK